MPQYPGQGKRLPENFGHEGEWVSENSMFLFRGDPHADQTQEVVFNPIVMLPNGRPCLGFDAIHIARRLNVTLEALFAANRAGTLSVEGQRSTQGVTAGARAFNVKFAIGANETVILVETANLREA